MITLARGFSIFLLIVYKNSNVLPSLPFLFVERLSDFEEDERSTVLTDFNRFWLNRSISDVCLGRTTVVLGLKVTSKI